MYRVRDLATAMDGDLVLAKIVGEKDEKSSTEGEIVKILKRNTEIIVGAFIESKNFSLLFLATISSHMIFLLQGKT